MWLETDVSWVGPIAQFELDDAAGWYESQREGLGMEQIVRRVARLRG